MLGSVPAACRVVLKRPKSVKYRFDANNQDQIAATSVRQGLFCSYSDEEGGHSRADVKPPQLSHLVALPDLTSGSHPSERRHQAPGALTPTVLQLGCPLRVEKLSVAAPALPLIPWGATESLATPGWKEGGEWGLYSE